MTRTAPSLYPSIQYTDARAAIAFLQNAFGFTQRVVYPDGDGGMDHAEPTLGDGVLMLGTRRGGRLGPEHPPYVAVDNPDGHCERARAAGAAIVAQPYDTGYGSREYRAQDPEGNVWVFGTCPPPADDPA